jgi:hypothetical protein
MVPSESSVTSGGTTRWKRRFSRHKEINRDQNDTVIKRSKKLMKFAYSLRDLISVPPLTKSMRRNYHLISTNLLDLFELKSISWPKREIFL